MNNRTFAIIKPDAVRNGNTGKIYDRILKADFKILCAKLLRMTVAQAEGFYAVHRERPFFNELTEFMSSGACMVLALEKDDAVNEWTELTTPERVKKVPKIHRVNVRIINTIFQIRNISILPSKYSPGAGELAIVIWPVTNWPVLVD